MPRSRLDLRQLMGDRGPAITVTDKRTRWKMRCGMPGLGLTRFHDSAASGIDSRMAGNLVQGAVFTVMVVRAGLLHDPAFEAELAEQIRRSPRFFLNAPVIL